MKKKSLAIFTSVALIATGIILLFRNKAKAAPVPPIVPPNPNVTPTATLANLTSHNNTYLTKSGTRMRNTPDTSGSSNIVYTYPVAGTELLATQKGTDASGFTWYVVTDGSGRSGMVRSDVVTLKGTSGTSTGGTSTGGTTTAVTFGNPTANFNTYLTKSGTRLRSTPNATSTSNIVTTFAAAGTELKAREQGVGSDGLIWYKIETPQSGYVREDAVSLKQTTTTTAGGTAPPISNATSLKTKSGTRLRSSATTDVSSNIIYTYPSAGTILTVLSELTGNNAGTGGYTWYKVSDSTGRLGFVRVDAVTFI